MVKTLIFIAAVAAGGATLHYLIMKLLKRKPQIATIILNFDKLLK